MILTVKLARLVIVRDPIVRSGRLHCCLRALPPPSPPRAKNLPTFPLFFSTANPHKICPSAKKSYVVTFCPKNGGPDVDFWALCAILGLPAVEVRRHPSLTSPGEQQSNQANILQIALRDFWLYKMGGHK